jgi:hypothetical protein
VGVCCCGGGRGKQRLLELKAAREAKIIWLPCTNFGRNKSSTTSMIKSAKNSKDALQIKSCKSFVRINDEQNKNHLLLLKIFCFEGFFSSVVISNL